MIEIRHLKLIKAIHDLGTLKGAAERLFLTQSALSHQLKELEARLGTKVFHRVNNRLVFTPSGKQLLETSDVVLDELKKTERAIQELNKDALKNYIHGYSEEECNRLNDQAQSIAEILHRDSIWEAGAQILEAGCGVGAQTKLIAAINPHASFVSVDLSAVSLEKAKQLTSEEGLTNVSFAQADITALPYASDTFDHIFVCFVLEHLTNPALALSELKRVLKKEGTITVIEGDHGSTYFFPDSEDAQKAIASQVLLQKNNGGNAMIGRALHPLLSGVGFQTVSVSPRQIYVDDSKPEMKDGFIKNTFTAMIKGIEQEAVAHGIIDKDTIHRGIQDLLQTADPSGTFCYTFFKAKGVK